MNTLELLDERKRCIFESIKCEKQKNFSKALELKLKEINCLKLIPEEHFKGKIPRNIDLARSYRTAAKFAVELKEGNKSKNYLLKSSAYFWKAYNSNEINYTRELEDLVFVHSLIGRIYREGHSITKEMKKRIDDAVYGLASKLS